MHKTIKQLIEDLEGAGFSMDEAIGGDEFAYVDLENHPAWQAIKTHLIVTSDLGHIAQRGAETQHSIMQWANETFGTSITPGRAALRSLEEMVELCVEVGLSNIDIAAQVSNALEAAKAKRKGIQHAAEELADVSITLCRLAYALGPVNARRVPRDLEDTFSVCIQHEVDKKMQINRARKWALDGQGSGQHVDTADVNTHAVDALGYGMGVPPSDLGRFNCRGDYVYKPAMDAMPRHTSTLASMAQQQRSSGRVPAPPPFEEGTLPCPTCLGTGEVDERLGGEAHSGVVMCPYDRMDTTPPPSRYAKMSNPAKVLGALLMALAAWVGWATFCGLAALINYAMGN